jgi:preprotein translocase subunit SecG
MFTIVAILSIILAAILILVVLIQPGKGEMLTGIGGISGQFNSVLGTKKATDLLKNITVYTAVAIAVLCLVYNLANERPEATNNLNLPSTLQQGEIAPASPSAPEIVPEDSEMPAPVE